MFTLGGGRWRAIVILAMLVPAGCTTTLEITATPTAVAVVAVPTPTDRAALSPQPSPTEHCLEARIQRDLLEMTLVNLAAGATVIGVGTFDGYRATRWNTPDGTRPISAMDALLERPMDVTVATMIRGDVAEFGNVVDPGGVLGCHSVTFSDEREIVAGTRYVFFLASVTDSRGLIGDKRALIDAWAVDSQNLVKTCRDGVMPLGDLVTKVAGLPYGGKTSGNIMYGSPCAST